MSVANSLSSSQFMQPDSLFETQNHSVTFNQSEGLPLDMIRDMQRNMNALGGVQVWFLKKRWRGLGAQASAIIYCLKEVRFIVDERSLMTILCLKIMQ